MKLQILITVIAFINGVTFGNFINDREMIDQKIHIRITFLFFYALLGSLLMFGELLWLILKNITIYIANTTQISFWFRYYTKRLDNIPEETKKIMNTNSRTKFGMMLNENVKMKLMDEHYLYCLKLLREKFDKVNDEDWKWIDNEENYIRK